MKQLRRLYLMIGMFALIALLLMSCAHLTGKTPASIKPYSNDGMLGLSDANPNLVSNSSSHTYVKDKRVVLSALKQVKGVEKSNIVFNGPYLYVYLKLSKHLDDAAKAKIQETAFETISFNMPRYRVNVIVGRNKLHN